MKFTLVLVALLLVAGSGILLQNRESSGRGLVRVAAWKLARGDARAAAAAAEKACRIEADDYATLILAYAKRRLNDDLAAVKHANAVVESADVAVRQKAHALLGEIRYLNGALDEAEAHWRAAAELDPRDLRVNEHLGKMLYLEGRTWEARPYVQEQLRHGSFSVDQLVMLASTEGWVLDDPAYIGRHREKPLIQLGRARVDLMQNRPENALQRLESLRNVVNGRAAIEAAYGRSLFQLQEDDRLSLWYESALGISDRLPELSASLGLAAERAGLIQQAKFHFASALEQDPNHQLASYRLALLATREGDSKLARQLFRRSEVLSEIQTLAGELSTIKDARMMEQISRLLNKIGRHLEAAAWADIARRFTPEATWYQREESLASTRRMESTRVTKDGIKSEIRAIVAKGLGSTFARPVASANTSTSPDSHQRDHSKIRFVDVADQVGLSFQYDVGKDVAAGMEHIFETTGGGVAVIDYDQDGYVDLHFAQGGRWDATDLAAEPSDEFFRNHGGQSFSQCTEQAGLVERRFSQGVTAGDINDDGFPDLFICNLGRNTLFINNGDGTFTDRSEQLGFTSEVWSLSAAIADVNGDTFADLYVVNYLDRNQVAERSCKHEGMPRSCAPTMFAGEQDRLLLGDGQGGFLDVTKSSGIERAGGKGLGILVADFFGNGVPEIYVGNDTAANFFFTRQNAEAVPPAEVSFEESAVPLGLAYNDRGRVQATMGMATTDLNGDGRLDIFATNFFADANTVYLQTKDHFFTEQTRQTNLYDAGYQMLGFGTQFIDTDNRGIKDIVITNGHVDRTFATGEPDAMRPQMFRNIGQSRFEEVPASIIGGYFEKELLGRALAVADWNNDGRQDLIVTHLDKPVALLANNTPSQGRFIQLRLIGTKTARDPIGAAIELSFSDGSFIGEQLTAGDGYEVRNDTRLTLGLGEASAGSIEVRWPSGLSQTWPLRSTDNRFALVEGRRTVAQDFDTFESERP